MDSEKGGAQAPKGRPESVVSRASASSSTAVFGRYFAEVRKHPRLTREDERRISGHIRAGNREAINDLVTPNLPYVAKIARQYLGRGVPYDDLLHEGSLGLMEAALRFDPDRDIRFVVYAVWWIRKYLIDAILRQSGQVHVPRRALQARHQGGRHAALPLPREISLDAEVGHDGGLALHEVLADPAGQTAEQTLIEKQMGGSVALALGILSSKERLVLTRRFGLDGCAPVTLQELGEEIGVTRERVRQIEIRAKARLRRILMRRISVRPASD